MQQRVVRLVDRLPEGWSEVSWRDRRWGVTVVRSDDGRRRRVYAEELGGTGVVSANLYVTDGGEHLRPCEMPAEEVLAFLREQVAADRRVTGTRLYRVAGPLEAALVRRGPLRPRTVHRAARAVDAVVLAVVALVRRVTTARR